VQQNQIYEGRSASSDASDDEGDEYAHHQPDQEQGMRLFVDSDEDDQDEDLEEQSE